MRANAGPGRLLTASDVESLGLDAEEPLSPECPYCGDPLEPLAVELDGRAYWVSHRDCGCEGERSVRERREAEERRERRRSRRLARGGEAETAAAIASRLAEMCEPVPLTHRDRRRCG